MFDKLSLELLLDLRIDTLYHFPLQCRVDLKDFIYKSLQKCYDFDSFYNSLFLRYLQVSDSDSAITMYIINYLSKRKDLF